MADNNEVFGVSLNELAFLLFFLIVLLSAIKINSSNDEVNKSKQENINLVQQLKLKQKDLDETLSELTLLRDKIHQLFSSNTTFDEDLLDKQFTQLVRLEEERSKLEEMLKATTEQLNELSKESEVVKELKEFLQKNGVDSTEKLIAELKAERTKNKTLLGQYKNIERKLEGNGLDHPPCWANSGSGKPEYMFTVTINPESYYLEQAWPKDRLEEMLVIAPKLSKVVPSEISHDDFKKYARPILKSSNEQVPICRHFVKIRDSDLTTKDEYKKSLAIIENYFYKLILR